MGNRQVRSRVLIGGRYNKRDGFPELPQPGIDVYPSIPERMYRVEGDIETLQREFRDHREESIRHAERWATKEHLADLEKVITEKLGDIAKRLDKRVGYQILQTVGLIATLLYAVILSYKHFIQP